MIKEHTGDLIGPLHCRTAAASTCIEEAARPQLKHTQKERPRFVRNETRPLQNAP